MKLLAGIAALITHAPATVANPLQLAAIVTGRRSANHEDSESVAAAAHAQAAIEALRAIIHSLTLELGPTARLNLILAETPTCEALSATFAALADPGTSASLAGATIDLRHQ